MALPDYEEICKIAASRKAAVEGIRESAEGALTQLVRARSPLHQLEACHVDLQRADSPPGWLRSEGDFVLRKGALIMGAAELLIAGGETRRNVPNGQPAWPLLESRDIAWIRAHLDELERKMAMKALADE